MTAEQAMNQLIDNAIGGYEQNTPASLSRPEHDGTGNDAQIAGDGVAPDATASTQVGDGRAFDEVCQKDLGCNDAGSSQSSPANTMREDVNHYVRIYPNGAVSGDYLRGFNFAFEYAPAAERKRSAKLVEALCEFITPGGIIKINRERTLAYMPMHILDKLSQALREYKLTTTN